MRLPRLPSRPILSPSPEVTVDAPKKRRPHEPRPGRRNPTKTSRAERQYAKALKSVARQTGALIAAFEAGNGETLSALMQLLKAYADAIKPWARVTSERMMREVNHQDLKSWNELGEAISEQIHYEIKSTPLGDRVRQLLNEQVPLIQSIPLEAAKRVQELTLRGLENSSRGEEVVREIMRSTQVSESRAKLIANTEVARTAAVFAQARAEQAGSKQYVWRTMRDGSVRDGHRAMEGRVCEWANPPAVDEGGGRIMHHHPGMIWRCRCYAEAVFPDD